MKNQYTCFIISRWILLRTRNVKTKFVEKINKHCMLISSGIKYCRANRAQMTIWRQRISCWITKVTSTLSQYVIPFLFFHCNNGCASHLNGRLDAHCLSRFPLLFFKILPNCYCCFLKLLLRQLCAQLLQEDDLRCIKFLNVMKGV